MLRFNSMFSIAAVAAAALLSGTAYAATLQPADGNGPLFNNQPTVTSTVQRQVVRAAAATHEPAAGEFSAHASPAALASTLTRAQVRAATSQAIAHGYHVRVGDIS